MFYIPTKYEEHGRTLLIPHPFHPSVNSALRASDVDLPWTPKEH